MYWDDDRSLYLVKTVSAVEELHLKSFYTPIFVSDLPVPYLMRAFSDKALTLSYAWVWLIMCVRYVILLGTKPNIKWLCSYRIPYFSVDGHIFVSLCSQNFNSN